MTETILSLLIVGLLAGCASTELKVVDKNEVVEKNTADAASKEINQLGKIFYKGKLFTGIVETKRNGKLYKREQFLNGDQHGLLEEYHDNGKIKVKAFIRILSRADAPEPLPNGMLSVTYNLERKEWDEQGKLTLEVKADENGRPWYHWRDGKILIGEQLLENGRGYYGPGGVENPESEFTKAHVDKVRQLFFAEEELTKIPEGLEKFTQLILIDFQRNRLTNMEGLEKLTQLKGLDFNNNKLTSMKGLEKLNQLKALILGFNQLTSVKELEELTKLRFLHLNNNKLTSVKGLENLTQLTSLDLGYNQLTDVTGLEKLMGLTGLNLNDNPDLTKAQIDELQKALPNCKIEHNAKK